MIADEAHNKINHVALIPPVDSKPKAPSAWQTPEEQLIIRELRAGCGAFALAAIALVLVCSGFCFL